jgi:hypothetical protein
MKHLVFLLLIVVFSLPSIAQEPPMIPKYDSLEFIPNDSVYKYYMGDKMVLWKSYRTGSMSYLPGQAIGGGYDSAYLYFVKGWMILYTYESGTVTKRTMAPNSRHTTIQSIYKGMVVGSGKYLLKRDVVYYPQWLNMPLQPRGVVLEWNPWFKTSTRKNYDTVLKYSPKGVYPVGSIQKILQGADSLLRMRLGDSVVTGYVRLNPWQSTVVGTQDGKGVHPILAEAGSQVKALAATLSYEIRLADSLRFEVITLRVDSAGKLFRGNPYESLPTSGLSVEKPQARYLNMAYLLKRAAAHGFRNDHRLFWNFYYDQYIERDGHYKIEILYLTNPGARHAEEAEYKQLIIDATTGKETFNANYQVQFETVGPPAEGPDR